MNKLLKHLKYFRITCLCLLTISSNAANWYCKPASSGDATGTSWSNARTLASVNSGTGINAGDTVWFSAGSYGGLTPNKTGTASGKYSYCRARSDAPECTSSSGWSASFDSTVLFTGISVDENDAFIVISGRTAANGGSYGMKIDRSGTTGGAGIYYSGGADNCTFEYMELRGPGYVTYSSDGRAVDMTPVGSGDSTAANNVFSHLWIHDWESGIYNVRGSAAIFEHIVMEDIMPVNWQSYHPNGIISWGSPNCIVRYCTFRKGPHGYTCGEGVFFEQSGGCTGWKIYGNTFEHLNLSGGKSIEVTSQVGPMDVYNNTFADCSSAIYTSNSPGNTGGNWKNNLYYSTSAGGIGTQSNNQTATASDFVGASANDYRLTATATARNAGATLTSDGFINFDRNGVQRGADGQWDVGAYEYGTVTNPPPVRLPTPGWMRRTTQ